jgi:hypothetical protein
MENTNTLIKNATIDIISVISIFGMINYTYNIGFINRGCTNFDFWYKTAWMTSGVFISQMIIYRYQH